MNNQKTVNDIALELAQARAAGADAATVRSLVDALQEAGGAAAIADPEAWVNAAITLVADGAESRCLEVWWQFALWLLTDPTEGSVRFCGNAPDCREAIETAANLYQRLLDGETVDSAEFRAAALAANAAWAAARAAGAAARAAGAAAASAWAATWAARAADAAALAWAATWAARAVATWAATWANAADAADAARAARASMAWADAVAAALAANAAWAAARAETYQRFAAKLVELLGEAK